ncbi:hypothetical protein [Corynebacterium anserum]|uniref:Uncharacterized protein n=1 Tax=Corynebacterium anserum TaxID=2684406 RepID=A0A7G7YQL3_9CORY|nr:hypothetical protein [Corynebacterium anserum]QNH96783.1 hypothetical protein GP473_09120 [Corynebacterium anserum]
MAQYKTNTDDFVKAIAAQANISEDSARTQLDGSHFYTASEQPTALAQVKTALFHTAEFLHSEGEIGEPEGQAHYAHAVTYGG